jgi:hypothetical protein
MFYAVGHVAVNLHIRRLVVDTTKKLTFLTFAYGVSERLTHAVEDDFTGALQPVWFGGSVFLPSQGRAARPFAMAQPFRAGQKKRTKNREFAKERGIDFRPRIYYTSETVINICISFYFMK